MSVQPQELTSLLHLNCFKVRGKNATDAPPVEREVSAADEGHGGVGISTL